MSTIGKNVQYGWSTSRLEALSDGVLAIVITLLVLDFATVEHKLAELSQASSAEVLSELKTMWPHVLGYTLSFFLIGVSWLTHHTIFRYIRKTDLGLLSLNLIFLMSVAFVPFPTGLLAECIGHESNVIVVLYGTTHLIASLALLTLWMYASHDERLIDSVTSPDLIRRISLATASRPLLYLLGILISFSSIPSAIAFFALTPIAYLTLGNHYGLWGNGIEVLAEPTTSSSLIPSRQSEMYY
ncbi:MAG: TMEM175 family protein [Pirellulaceae bacterium]|nr:TMEM175 family protein [Pirellulaceae bacterium]